MNDVGKLATTLANRFCQRVRNVGKLAKAYIGCCQLANVGAVSRLLEKLSIYLRQLFCKHPRWIELHRDYQERCLKCRCLKCGKAFYEGI